MNNISPYADVLAPLFNRVQAKEAIMLASVVTEAEVLLLPTRNRDESAIQDIEDLFSEDGIQIVAVDRAIGRRAAQLRAAYKSLSLPDAMIVASALHFDCDLIVGNDRKWKTIQDIPYLHLDEFINT